MFVTRQNCCFAFTAELCLLNMEDTVLIVIDDPAFNDQGIRMTQYTENLIL